MVGWIKGKKHGALHKPGAPRNLEETGLNHEPVWMGQQLFAVDFGMRPSEVYKASEAWFYTSQCTFIFSGSVKILDDFSKCLDLPTANVQASQPIIGFSKTSAIVWGTWLAHSSFAFTLMKFVAGWSSGISGTGWDAKESLTPKPRHLAFLLALLGVVYALIFAFPDGLSCKWLQVVWGRECVQWAFADQWDWHWASSWQSCRRGGGGCDQT